MKIKDEIMYTVHDVEIIRRQARAQGQNECEISDEMRVVMENYEQILQHVRKKCDLNSSGMTDELAQAVNDRDILQDDIQRLDRGYNLGLIKKYILKLSVLR